jgi:hypothetical protein
MQLFTSLDAHTPSPHDGAAASGLGSPPELHANRAQTNTTLVNLIMRGIVLIAIPRSTAICLARPGF